LKELPEKIEDVRRCSLSGDQLKFYRDLVNNQGQELVQKLKDPDEKVPYMHIFALLNYLKQVCDHPALLEGERTNYKKYSSGKWDLFIELLEREPWVWPEGGRV
jgi:SNF2 family DNA or RNA helicase